MKEACRFAMHKARPHAELVRVPLRAAAPHVSARRGALGRAAPWMIAAVIAAVLLFVIALPVPAWIRAAAILAIALAGLVVRARTMRVVERAPDGWIAADAKGIARIDIKGTTRLADWSSRFGVTVLANERRDRGLLAFTTLEQTRYVRVRAAEDESSAAHELFARASIASDSDVMLGARGEDDVALGAADALSVLATLRARAAEALGRIFLSDSRGGAIVLDGDALHVGDHVIDLNAPVEWRGFMFFESAGHMSTLVQATWVRQAGVEVVLVAPLPAEVSGVRRVLGVDVEAERAAARDLRLMQAAPDQPPPHELRLGIERLFMVPLRQALDRAPRSVRTISEPAPRKRPEGHAS